MNASVIGAPARHKESPSHLGWLGTLSREERQSLTIMDRAAAELVRSDSPPDLALDVFEQARIDYLHAVESSLRPLRSAAFPIPLGQWETLQQVLASLRRARDLYHKLYALLVEDSGVATRMVIPGTSAALANVLPLARALDFQARVLRAQLIHRIEVEAADWLALVRVSGPLRSSTFQDTSLPDQAPLFKSTTARALFCYPLLLMAAQPPIRDDAEIELIDRMARSWAGKVGYRVDEDGRIHESRHGPTLLLAEDCAVRLDTHRLLRRVDERAELIGKSKSASDLKLPRGLSRERTLRLHADLKDCWGDAHRPHILPRGASARLRVRLGVPAMREGRLAADSAAVPFESGGAPSTHALPTGMASKAYVYGRMEQDTIMRRARGADDVAGNALSDYLGAGELVTQVGRLPGQGWDVLAYERVSVAPMKPGVLVALRSAEREHSPLQIGWVVSLQMFLAPNDASRPSQRIGVHLWPVPAQLAGLRLAESPFYEDVFFLPGGPHGTVNTVVLPPGRWRTGALAMLRLPRRDSRIEFGQLVERGAGFDRVEVRQMRD